MEFENYFDTFARKDDISNGQCNRILHWLIKLSLDHLRVERARRFVGNKTIYIVDRPHCVICVTNN